jgi:hypothetical protein
MTYLGRTDTQIKVLGHRVELGEIEAVIRYVTVRPGNRERNRKFADSPLEGAGFEPSVPREGNHALRTAPLTAASADSFARATRFESFSLQRGVWTKPSNARTRAGGKTATCYLGGRWVGQWPKGPRQDSLGESFDGDDEPAGKVSAAISSTDVPRRRGALK